jgi:predicted secreted protein
MFKAASLLTSAVLARHYKIELDALDQASSNQVYLLNLSAGDTVQILKSENPSTGYTWHYSETDGLVYEIISDQHVAANSEQMMVGVPGKRVLDLSIVGQGNDVMKLASARGFEWQGFTEDLNGVIEVHLVSENESQE